MDSSVWVLRCEEGGGSVGNGGVSVVVGRIIFSAIHPALTAVQAGAKCFIHVRRLLGTSRPHSPFALVGLVALVLS